MSTIQGPCWVRYNDGHVAWIQNGWKALGQECAKLPCLDLGRLLRVPEDPVEAAEASWQPRTPEEYDQAVWDAYRTNDRYREILAMHDLAGPDDFEEALESKVILNEDDPEDIEASGPLYLSDHVLHTVTAFAAGLSFSCPYPS